MRLLRVQSIDIPGRPANKQAADSVALRTQGSADAGTVASQGVRRLRKAAVPLQKRERPPEEVQTQSDHHSRVGQGQTASFAPMACGGGTWRRR